MDSPLPRRAPFCFRMDDQENMASELIAEGMDEAVHEQMLAARRERDEEDADDAREDEG